MSVLLLLVFLFLLWGFIAWDRRRPASPVSDQSLAKGWMPRLTKKWPLTLGLSLCCFFMALAEWLQPDLPPFTGKFAFLAQYAHDCFGSVGLVYLWVMVAIGFLMAAAVQWRKQATLSDGRLNV